MQLISDFSKAKTEFRLDDEKLCKLRKNLIVEPSKYRNMSYGT